MGSDGTFRVLRCLVDTGFDGDLALPAATIRSLGLIYVGPSDTVLLDGPALPLPMYDGVARWHGGATPISVLETQQEALIGMALLENSTLTVEVWDGGDVLIEPS